MNARPLVLCAHGTRSAHGRAAVEALVVAVAASVDGPVLPAYVDVHGPLLREVLAPGMSVVPLLLAPGHHQRVDISATAHELGDVLVAEPLGPSPKLSSLLVDRLLAAGLRPGDAVVLGAAGSSDPAAARSVEAAAEGLAALLGVDVRVAYGGSRYPSVAETVTGLRSQGHHRVAVASYLLAAGHFHGLLRGSGADVVSEPLIGGGEVDPRLVSLVLQRAGRARALAAA